MNDSHGQHTARSSRKSQSTEGPTLLTRVAWGCESRLGVILAIVICGGLSLLGIFNQRGKPLAIELPFPALQGGSLSPSGEPRIRLTGISNGQLLASADFGQQQDVLRLDLSGTSMMSQTFIAQSDAYSETNPLWSPDSGGIAFVSNRGGTNRIYVTTPAGVQPVTPISLTGGLQISFDTPMAWAPDSQHIAFVAVGEDSGRVFNELFVAATDSSPPIQLTFDKDNVFTPVWIDSARIAYVSAKKDGTTVVVLRSADGITSQNLYTLSPIP